MELLLDEDGYLHDLSAWDKKIARELAAHEQITLTEAHWELIEAVRIYFSNYDHTPSMRPLVRWIKTQIDAEKGTSIYLHKLFPRNPAKQLARIAGLPKPTKCL